MAIAMKGLRLKPKYEELINVAVSDKLYNIKFPNRDAKFLRNGFVLSQLDGEGARIMERQQEMASKEAYKEHLLKEIAKNTGANFHDLRNDNHDDLRRQRVNNAVHFDISQGDDDMDDDMDDGAGGAGIGVQTTSPSTRVGMTQTTTSTDERNTQTPTVRKKDKDTQASSPILEDNTEEIERLKAEHEAHVEEMKRHNEIKISNIVNQVRAETTQDIRHQTMAEASQLHDQIMANRIDEMEFSNAQRMRALQLKYEQKLLEMAQDNDLTKRQAKQYIQQSSEQAREEARQFTGRVFDYHEDRHRRAQQEAKEANERAKKAENAARNEEHKNQRTPPPKTNAKAKSGPSPKKGTPLPSIPPYPTGNERASGSNDQPNYGDNPESEHEPKGNRGKKTTNTKVKQETFTKNPTRTTHGTQKDETKSRSHWEKQKKAYLVDQLYHRKWEYPRTRTGKPAKLTLAQLREILFQLDPSINQP